MAVSLEQRSPEWYEFRRNHIGASDIATIMGNNPYKTKYELFLEKLEKGKPQKMNANMQRGIELEPIARYRYVEISGIPVMPDVIVYPEWDIASASLDGISESRKLICEIKCPNKLHISIPQMYIDQVQWQMMVAMAFYKVDVRADIFQYINNEIWDVTALLPDALYHQKMLKEAKDFWDLVKEGIAPEILSKEYILNESLEYLQYAKDYMYVDEKAKEYINRRNTIKRSLIDLTDDGNMRGGGVSIRRSEGKSTTNWNKLCTDLNISDEVIAKYSKRGLPSWTITVDKSNI